MGNRAAKRGLAGPLRIDMDELSILGALREAINPVWLTVIQSEQPSSVPIRAETAPGANGAGRVLWASSLSGLLRQSMRAVCLAQGQLGDFARGR